MHWLKAQERIQYKLTVLMFERLHGTAPSYLANEFIWSSDLNAQSRLRSASSSSLIVFVHRTRLSTVGDRAFPVAAAFVFGTNYRVTSRHVSTVSGSFLQSSEDQLPFLSRLSVML